MTFAQPNRIRPCAQSCVRHRPAVVRADAQARLQSGEVRVWEVQEITLAAARDYANPYVDVECWVELEGPDFRRRVYGFWDGGRTFKVRIVATRPGEWTWRAGSNRVDDPGLSGSGKFRAVPWSAAEIEQNPNRRGFVRASENGHALTYADGTPFFLVGDTWLAASTWRLPWKGTRPADDYVPAEGISFEEAVAWRKRQGYNSISFISAFPNWDADQHGATFANKDGVFLRNAWEKFGYWAPNARISTADGATTTGKDMHDEQGNRPFEVFADREGLANFDRVNPAYFRSLDRKMRHLSEQGFVPFLETIRRDNAPSWKRYFNFNESYARFVQYLIARYGAYNLVFSGIHLDWIPKDFSLTADEFNEALTFHHRKYGGLPFGQPYTTLIDRSTFKVFGHGSQAPWLTMHTVGNNPRNHAIYDSHRGTVPPRARIPGRESRALLHGLESLHQSARRRVTGREFRAGQLLRARHDVRLRAVGRAGRSRARHRCLRRHQHRRTGGLAATHLDRIAL